MDCPSFKTKLRELPTLYKRNDEILTETARLLREEKENDDRLRAEFKDKWTRVPSEQLTAPLIQELMKYRHTLQAAANADGIVSTKFQQHQQGIDILSKTEGDLRMSIPDTSNSGSGEANNASMGSIVSKLRNLMDQVQEVKVEREKVEKELKQVRFDMSGDFLKSMSENGVVNEEKMSSEKIQELFAPLKTRVEQSLKRQEALMGEVEVSNKKFTESKHGRGGSEREAMLKLLATAHDTFFELEGNLKEGTKFYNDLTPILVRLQQKVSDFCFARQTEKDDLMKQVQKNIVSGGRGGSGKVPPSRPPPPAAPYQQWNPMQQAPSAGAQPSPQSNFYNPYAPAGSYPYDSASQPAFPQNYTTPYPLTYPGGYPQQYSNYPPQPAFPPPQQPPQNQGTNPFA